MTTFTYADEQFSGRTDAVNTYVWFTENPEQSYTLPRSFSYEDVADALLVSMGLGYITEQLQRLAVYRWQRADDQIEYRL